MIGGVVTAEENGLYRIWRSKN